MKHDDIDRMAAEDIALAVGKAPAWLTPDMRSYFQTIANRSYEAGIRSALAVVDQGGRAAAQIRALLEDAS